MEEGKQLFELGNSGISVGSDQTETSKFLQGVISNGAQTGGAQTGGDQTGGAQTGGADLNFPEETPAWWKDKFGDNKLDQVLNVFNNQSNYAQLLEQNKSLKSSVGKFKNPFNDTSLEKLNYVYGKSDNKDIGALAKLVNSDLSKMSDVDVLALNAYLKDSTFNESEHRNFLSLKYGADVDKDSDTFDKAKYDLNMYNLRSEANKTREDLQKLLPSESDSYKFEEVSPRTKEQIIEERTKNTPVVKQIVDQLNLKIGKVELEGLDIDYPNFALSTETDKQKYVQLGVNYLVDNNIEVNEANLANLGTVLENYMLRNKFDEIISFVTKEAVGKVNSKNQHQRRNVRSGHVVDPDLGGNTGQGYTQEEALRKSGVMI